MIWLHRLLGRSDIYLGASLYMRRWRLGFQRWPGFRLHHIVRSDADRELHDHPFSFVSIILRGGYWEHLADGTRTWHGPGSILFRSAEVLHRLELPRPAWTFVFRGPIRRPWGFMTAFGWVPWQRFTAGRSSEVVGSPPSSPFVAPSSAGLPKSP